MWLNQFSKRFFTLIKVTPKHVFLHTLTASSGMENRWLCNLFYICDGKSHCVSNQGCIADQLDVLSGQKCV